MPDYTNTKFEITILADCIFKLKSFKDVEIDVEDVYEMRKQYLHFSNGKPFAILMDATDYSSVTAEARILLVDKEFIKMRIATAFVTRSIASNLIANFFIKFHKPASPTKLFKDFDTAFEWLKQQTESQK